MSLPVATISLEFTGSEVRAVWRILPSSHEIGVSSGAGRAGIRGVQAYRMLDDIGSPEGAEKVAHVLFRASAAVTSQFLSAWSQQGLF